LVNQSIERSLPSNLNSLSPTADQSQYKASRSTGQGQHQHKLLYELTGGRQKQRCEDFNTIWRFSTSADEQRDR